VTAVNPGPTAGPRAGQGGGPAINRSVTRALSILELLSQGEAAMTLGEVATRLKLPKSSTLSLLRALVAGEFCVTDEKGVYALGVHTFEVGAGYLRSMTPVRSVTPELEWLTEVLGMTSHFAVLDGDEVIYLAKHDPPGLGLKLASSLGARLPAAVTAVGKAQLSYRGGGPEVLATLSTGDDGRAPAGGTELGLELERVRKRGYAVDEGQTAVGIRCVAAPLFNDGGCCGAVGVSYLMGGGPAALAVVAQAVMEAAGRASGRLGGRGPDAQAGERNHMTPTRPTPTRPNPTRGAR
jgi:DNA-binding IclR family transcriptional regulator